LTGKGLKLFLILGAFMGNILPTSCACSAAELKTMVIRHLLVASHSEYEQIVAPDDMSCVRPNKMK